MTATTYTVPRWCSDYEVAVIVHPVGFLGAKAGPLVAVPCGAIQTSRTAANINIGAPSAGRLIVIALAQFADIHGYDFPTGVSAGGASLAFVDYFNVGNPLSFQMAQSFWVGQVPAGTTANVQISGGRETSLAYQIYAVTGSASARVAETEYELLDGVISLPISAGGVMIACREDLTSAPGAWTGAVAANAQLWSPPFYSSAYYAAASAESSHQMTCGGTLLGAITLKP